MNSIGPLRAALEDWDCPLSELTVQSTQSDPFRKDTPAGHRDGAWLRDQMDNFDLTGPIHVRGLHYLLLGATRPDGTTYRNDDKNWVWLQDNPVAAARWLGYVPFSAIKDERNDEPRMYPHDSAEPHAEISRSFFSIPDDDDLYPSVRTIGFRQEQFYKIVIIGEKSGLLNSLQPLAKRYHADLYLPNGNMTDTQIHHLARSAQQDGRPLVVLYFSDCDPSGWFMPISVSRKLQAFRILFEAEGEIFPQIQVHRAALMPWQVDDLRNTEHELPETPVKETEKRGDRWTEVFGREQTEIDSLAVLHPRLFREMATNILDKFWDDTLGQRVRDYETDWKREAQQIIDEHVDEDAIEQARARLRNIRELADEVTDLQPEIDTTGLPPIELPEAEEPEGATPLLDSTDDFWDQCQRLIRSRDYNFKGRQ